MTVRVEHRDYPAGRFPVMVVTHEGEEYELEDMCDEDGDDWSGEGMPWGFKLVETSYKGTDGKEVARVQKLAEHPEALYEEYVDVDGDVVWRTFFKVP